MPITESYRSKRVSLMKPTTSLIQKRQISELNVCCSSTGDMAPKTFEGAVDNMTCC